MNIETAHRNVSSREQVMNPDHEYETTDELNNTKFREESCLSQHQNIQTNEKLQQLIENHARNSNLLSYDNRAISQNTAKKVPIDQRLL